MIRRRTRRPGAVAWTLLIVSGLAAATEVPAPVALTPLPLDRSGVTVSGISSGGAMAVQFHAAHALGRCMKGGDPLPVTRWLERADALAAAGAIDPPAALRGDRVWIYRGAADPHVARPVADALEQSYLARTDREAVRRVERAGAGHNFPVATAGLADCGSSAAPWLGSCGFDATSEMLGHLLGTLAPRAAAADPAALVAFDQRPYAAAAGSAAFADEGRLYVPAACRAATGAGDGDVRCRLHVVFHGCRQGEGEAAELFVARAGYLELADANRIVLLFPRIRGTLQPLNPLGCWDWWGYEGEGYATRAGPQVAAVRAMVDALLDTPREDRVDARAP